MESARLTTIMYATARISTVAPARLLNMASPYRASGALIPKQLGVVLTMLGQASLHPFASVADLAIRGFGQG